MAFLFEAVMGGSMLRWVVFVLLGAIGYQLGAAESTDESSPELDQQIVALIQELGSDEFTRRERAQAELERLGLVAFDALREAQQNDDIEIALRARYLVRRLQVRWFDDHDPPEVKRVLRDYGRQSDGERKSRMDRLAILENGEGLPALCRLVRFEGDLRLSKHAALLILKHGTPENPTQRESRAQQLRTTISLSKNPAAIWVKTFAQSLTDPAAADAAWSELIAAEQRTFANYPELTTPDIVIDLLRWRTEALLAADRRDEIMPLVRDSLDLVSAKREQVLSAVDWLIEHEIWTAVDDVAAKFPELFVDAILLQYRLAESQLKRGDTAKANETALAATQTKPEQFEDHVEAAGELQERGLFDWSEREYRYVIDKAGAGTPHELRARFYLSEMLHDQKQDLAAAEVLKVIADNMAKDPEFGKRIRNLNREPEEIAARMHFFYAEHYSTVDRAKQKEHLLEGSRSYPREIDLLIASFHFPDDDASWKAQVRQNIADTAGSYRDLIRQYSDNLQQMVGQPYEDQLRVILARLNNQLAWLVANTEGDFDEALRCSKLSLEYRPDEAGYLDTLGRCYYAKKDYENAVKYQSRAATLDPHSGAIRRQLELFQRALEESRAANVLP